MPRPRNDHHPLKDSKPSADPTYVIFREISARMDGDGLQFYFRDRAPADLPSGGITEFVDALVDEPIGYSREAFVGRLPRKECPLDLNVQRRTYVVFRLDRKLNWQFDPYQTAVSHKKREEGDRYGGMMHVMDNKGKKAGSVAPGNGCHLVYFIADPLPKHTGAEPQEEYKHGMNLYVELDQIPSHSGGERRALPLILDPDIRNPGGSIS
jgi:hypothetical protein